jgi:hypothetical protein
MKKLISQFDTRFLNIFLTDDSENQEPPSSVRRLMTI